MDRSLTVPKMKVTIQEKGMATMKATKAKGDKSTRFARG